MQIGGFAAMGDAGWESDCGLTLLRRYGAIPDYHADTNSR
jgi:hypothetical protein